MTEPPAAATVRRFPHRSSCLPDAPAITFSRVTNSSWEPGNFRGSACGRGTTRRARRTNDMRSTFGNWTWLTAACSLALGVGVSACTPKSAQKGGLLSATPPVETTLPADTLRLKRNKPVSADEARLTEVYEANWALAPGDYAGLAASLEPAAETAPKFDVKSSRFFNLVAKKLGLKTSQVAQLTRNGAISLRLPNRPTMGGVYAALWQADMPVLITTDSVLHAWHKTYDSVLKNKEVTQFSAAYRDLLEGLAEGLQRELQQPSQNLQAALKDLDLYVAVARTLLPPPSDGLIGLSGTVDPEPPDIESPKIAEPADVKRIVQAVYEQQVSSVPVFGRVDFTQFKPRGHYTKSDELARYFRAVMWMGRADTGFNLASPESARVALLMGLLADKSGKLAAFQKAQAAIDYFVGTSNGLSLVQVADVLRKSDVRTIGELEDDARVGELAKQLHAAASKSRVTSQGLFAEGGQKPPPPNVFQLSSQRFTLDSFVHEKVNFTRPPARTMVDGLDVFAAMGNDEATRLLEPELERYQFSREMFALRSTISQLPGGYWDQNIYTRWFDALRTLDDVPQGKFLPDLFRSQIWQRKQLNNQLASWAELRRDTILYVAQVYGGILCEFPDVYLEPYPAFYQRMHDMALEAERRLEEQYAFRGFVDVMNKLSDIATRQLTSATRNDEDRAYLKALVKSQVVGGGCGGPDVVWSGWYQDLFPNHDMFDFEPVVADVFTDPNTGGVLNVATTGPDLMVAALRTQDGPTLFAGPVAGYRQFVGSRMTDEEWEAKVLSGDVPPIAPWNALHAGQGRLPPPHR